MLIGWEDKRGKSNARIFHEVYYTFIAKHKEVDIIILECSPFVLDETISELVESLSSFGRVSQTRVSTTHQRSFEQHFDLVQIYDIAVRFASEHPFITGIVGNLATDALKLIFKKAYAGVSKNKPGKLVSFKVNFSYPNVNATFKLDEKYSQEDIDHCFDAFEKLVASRTLIEDSANPSLHKDFIKFSGVNYYYHLDKKLWLAYNYEKDREEMYRQMRELGH